MEISGNIIDIYNNRIFSGIIRVNNGIIESIESNEENVSKYICPGFTDAHIHIESSMVTPGSFARAAVSRGTVAVISDPHEIANVLGIEGVQYMINDSKKVPLKFLFGAPSCVPATRFETSGAEINADAIETLFSEGQIKYLAEMMNFPGVINNDREITDKLLVAKKYGRPIDGHAPGLSGNDLEKYVSAGISTDHECTSLGEALEKIRLGMKILIREGSAAKNLDELKELFRICPGQIMLCSDDLHPETLSERHLDAIVAKLVDEGFNLFDVLRSCSLNPAKHYNSGVGLLKPGQPADFIVVDDYRKMNVRETWINGKKVYEDGKVLFDYDGSEIVNKFNCSEISRNDIIVKSDNIKLNVIQALEADLYTRQTTVNVKKGIEITSDTGRDILKIIVKNRYTDMPPAVGFINGFGLKKGAFSGSVAHDSHNIICVGTNDEDIVNAVNIVTGMKGGLAVAEGKNTAKLNLNIAGLMSDRPVEEVASQYRILSGKVKEMGCRLASPFMTLSFMALLVIPELKLSDKGLFSGKKFDFVPLFTE